MSYLHPLVLQYELFYIINKLIQLKREIVTKKPPTPFEKILLWIGKYNWYVIAVIISGIAIFEVSEIIHKQDELTDPFHITELLLYIGFLILVGVLIHFLVLANVAQARTMQILEYKHNISLKLTELENWDTLTGELLKIPNTITSIEGSRLFVRNPISGELEKITHWNEVGIEPLGFDYDCIACLQKRSDLNYSFSSCISNANEHNQTSELREYCLPINYANSLYAIIQFKLKHGKQLSKDQVELFENISPEMSLALKASHERQRLADLRYAETALAERHSVSTYLHDHLSQNLAYICLKLEQLSREDEYLPEEYKQVDLRHMMDAANQSYEILRDMLETMHPETTPRLVNLIKEHAKKESERAHFEISIETNGQEFSVSPDVRKTVFYVFREALSNIEKHANAKSVKVFMLWDKDYLDVTVADDGVGFNLQQLDGNKHFGLDIMRERVDKVGGRIDVRSSTD